MQRKKSSEKGYEEKERLQMNLIHTQNRMHISHQPKKYCVKMKNSTLNAQFASMFFGFSHILKIDFCLFNRKFQMCIRNKRLFHIAISSAQLKFKIRLTTSQIFIATVYFSIFRFSDIRCTDILRIADDFRNSDEFNCWQ